MANSSFIHTFRFFIRLIKTSLQQSFALKGAFTLRMIFMIFNNLIMLVGWWAMFTTFKSINGWSFNDFIFMTGLCISSFSLWPIFFRGAGLYMSRLIEYGDLDNFILQPKNILFHVSASQSDPSGFGDLITGLLLIFFSGYLTLTTFPLVLFFIVMAFIVFLSINISVSSLPFYLKNSADISERLFYIFFNISSYPGSIYNASTKLVFCTLFPVGFISILPVALLHSFSGILLIYILCFVLTFFIISIFIFYNGLKHYESGNRISLK